MGLNERLRRGSARFQDSLLNELDASSGVGRGHGARIFEVRIFRV